MLTPLSLVASLDPERLHTFHCIANGSGRLDALIDGLFFNDQDILNKGITVTLDSSGVIDNSTIYIPATIENNETSIQCVVFANLGRLDSLIGRFYVQGKVAEYISNTSLCNPWQVYWRPQLRS